MWHEVVLAPEAVEDSRRLSARDRSSVRDALKCYLRQGPARESISSVKRLRGIPRPQYRLRVGDLGTFYDVGEGVVEILAIIRKSQAKAWLKDIGGEM